METPGCSKHVALVLRNSSDVFQRSVFKSDDLFNQALVACKIKSDYLDRALSRDYEFKHIFFYFRIFQETEEKWLRVLINSCGFKRQIFTRNLADFLITHQLGDGFEGIDLIHKEHRYISTHRELNLPIFNLSMRREESEHIPIVTVELRKHVSMLFREDIKYSAFIFRKEKEP